VTAFDILLALMLRTCKKGLAWQPKRPPWMRPWMVILMSKKVWCYY